MASYLIDAGDYELFQRCRRAWDFGARQRRNLERRASRPPDLGAALRDALAVYYFPGMWDWDRSIVRPLVVDGLARSLGSEKEEVEAAHRRGEAILEAYFEWAPGVDAFSPIRVETDLEARIPDPARPGHDLSHPDGRDIRYRCRIALLAIDEHDLYWVVTHRVGTSFAEGRDLELDFASLAACWAWERDYLGMEIAGTIYNEVRLDAEPPPPPSPPRRRLGAWLRRERRPVVRQHEPSGGGRSIPQHRRLYAKARQPDGSERVTVTEAGPFRRTRITRTRPEIDGVGQRLAAVAAEMIDPGIAVYPSPSPAHCSQCDFVAPCVAMSTGADYEAILQEGYRPRPTVGVEEGRLGAVTWGMGRGALPPPWWR